MFRHGRVAGNALLPFARCRRALFQSERTSLFGVTEVAAEGRAIRRAFQQKLQTQRLNAKLIPSGSTKRVKNARLAH
jgi:hypothetical protein